jgi:hypothetical protein
MKAANHAAFSFHIVALHLIKEHYLFVPKHVPSANLVGTFGYTHEWLSDAVFGRRVYPSQIVEIGTWSDNGKADRH